MLRNDHQKYSNFEMNLKKYPQNLHPTPPFFLTPPPPPKKKSLTQRRSIKGGTIAINRDWVYNQASYSCYPTFYNVSLSFFN